MIPAASILFFCFCISPILSVTVSFSTYPTIAAAPLNEDILDDLATTYHSSSPTISVEEFVFVWLPLWAFDTLSHPGQINHHYTVDEVLGILYFSGYWGGVWLREKLLFPPPSVPTTGTTASAQYDVSTATTAAAGANPLAYTSGQFTTAVGSFGYNAGYLRTIINNPPAGVTPIPNDYGWGFTYEGVYDDDALTIVYDTPQLVSPLAKASDWIDDLNCDDDFQTLKNTCIFIQSSAYSTGVSAWSNSTGLNVIDFAVDDYILLLQASSAFLEMAQYNALLITKSVGYQSQPIAKNAAINNAAMEAFNSAYLVGLLDGSDLPFPSF